MRGLFAVPSSGRCLCSVHFDEILVHKPLLFRRQTAHDVPFASRVAPRFTKRPIGTIFDMKGVKTMTEMRSLFEALLVLGVIVATGTVLGVLFR